MTDKSYAPLHLPEKLRRECEDILLLYDEFKRYESLITLCERALPSYKLVANLPRRESYQELIDESITFFLHKRRLTDGRFVLICVLETLHSKYIEYELEHNARLKSLIEEIRAELNAQMARNNERVAHATKSEAREELRSFNRAVENLRPSEPVSDVEPADTLDKWLDEVGDNFAQWALRVALAVFNGGSFEEFQRAYELLLVLLTPLEPPPAAPVPATGGEGGEQHKAEAPAPPPRLSPLGSSGRWGPMLARAGARIEGSTIRLDRPETAASVLAFVWREYHKTRLELREVGEQTPRALRYILQNYTDVQLVLTFWLTNLAEGYPSDTRAQAAVTAGLLAVADFNRVRHGLLALWLELGKGESDPILLELNGVRVLHRDPEDEDSSPAQYRAAFGRALAMAVNEPARRDDVRDYLRKLVRTGDSRVGWPAMRAYMYCGDAIPADEVVSQWQQIASTEKQFMYVEGDDNAYAFFANPLHMSLYDAFYTFFLNAVSLPTPRQREVFAGALRALGQWDDADLKEALKGVADRAEQNRRRRTANGLGLALFLTLAEIERSQPGGPLLPVLLDLVVSEAAADEYVKLLAGMCYRALTRDPTRLKLLERLKLWSAAAAYVPDGQVKLAALLRALIAISPERLTKFVSSQLRHWQSTAPVAGRLLQDLRLT